MKRRNRPTKQILIIDDFYTEEGFVIRDFYKPKSKKEAQSIINEINLNDFRNEIDSIIDQHSKKSVYQATPQ